MHTDYCICCWCWRATLGSGVCYVPGLCQTEMNWRRVVRLAVRSHRSKVNNVLLQNPPHTPQSLIQKLNLTSSDVTIISSLLFWRCSDLTWPAVGVGILLENTLTWKTCQGGGGVGGGCWNCDWKLANHTVCRFNNLLAALQLCIYATYTSEVGKDILKKRKKSFGFLVLLITGYTDAWCEIIFF